MKKGGLLCLIQPSGPLLYQDEQEFKSTVFSKVNLFKKDHIDYIEIARQRIEEVRKSIECKEELPSLFSALQPSARTGQGQTRKRGMMDIDEVLAQTEWAII